MTTSASPKSAWASPGGCASGTNISCPAQRLGAHVVFDDRVAAREGVLRAQPFPDALGRVALFLRALLIVAEDLINHPGEAVELRTPDRLRAPIPRRHAVCAASCAPSRGPVQSAAPPRARSTPPHIDATPHLRIELHSIHPSCVPQNTSGMLGGPLKRSGFPPPSPGVTPPRCGLFLRRRSQQRVGVDEIDSCEGRSYHAARPRPRHGHAHSSTAKGSLGGAGSRPGKATSLKAGLLLGGRDCRRDGGLDRHSELPPTRPRPPFAGAWPTVHPYDRLFH